MQYVKRINIQEDRTAVIFHGSNKPTRRKQMFSYYGLVRQPFITKYSNNLKIDAMRHDRPLRSSATRRGGIGRVQEHH